MLLASIQGYVQYIVSNLQDELNYCRYNADHLWNAYDTTAGVNARIKRQTYLRAPVTTGEGASGYVGYLLTQQQPQV
jgi:hypothetical protein